MVWSWRILICNCLPCGIINEWTLFRDMAPYGGCEQLRNCQSPCWKTRSLPRDCWTVICGYCHKNKKICKRGWVKNCRFHNTLSIWWKVKWRNIICLFNRIQLIVNLLDFLFIYWSETYIPFVQTVKRPTVAPCVTTTHFQRNVHNYCKMKKL